MLKITIYFEPCYIIIMPNMISKLLSGIRKLTQKPRGNNLIVKTQT